jgi:FkbM family methyltransferase
MPEAIVGVPFVNGTRIFMIKGMTGATGNWYCGLHEVDEMGFVLQMLRPGDTFIDIGANIGSYTLLAGSIPDTKIVAIEPVPSTFKYLENNIHLNRLCDRVIAHCKGLSDEPGILKFTKSLDTVNHVAIATDDKEALLDIPVLTLDDLAYNVDPVLIKIDVEGYEMPILRGAIETLKKPSLLAVMLETNGSGNRYGNADNEIFDIMSKSDFIPYGYDPFLKQIKPYTQGQANTIFIKSKAAILDRISNSLAVMSIK